MMRLNSNLIMRKIAGETVLVPSGDMAQKFNGMLTLNTVAAFIWEHVEQVKEREELVSLIMETFEVDEETATQDVNGFVDMMIKNGFLELDE